MHTGGKKRVDLTGRRVGRLTITGYAREHRTASCLQHIWCAMCDCGKTTEVYGNNFSRGHTKSCGCLRDEILGAASITHGGTRGRRTTPEYRSWLSMIGRCDNPKRWQFKYYGGRGIRVCDRWRSDFASFRDDMGSRAEGTTLDRINNDLGYDCGKHALCDDCKGRDAAFNCRWATQKEQTRNSRRCRHLTHGGRTLIVEEWSEATGLPGRLIVNRLKRGWDVARTLTTPR